MTTELDEIRKPGDRLRVQTFNCCRLENACASGIADDYSGMDSHERKVGSHSSLARLAG